MNYSRKPRIVYIDTAPAPNHYEDYSLNPKKWGGGSVMAKWAKEFWKDKFDFYILAPKACWEHIDEIKENKSCFMDLSRSNCDFLNSGGNIKDIYPEIDQFDIILHGHTNLFINNFGCRPVQVHWAGFGRASDGHPLVPYTLCYGKDLTPQYPKQKTYPIILGKPCPQTFAENQKEDFVFQCSRHDPTLDSIQVAQECINNKIRAIFAGPINENYPLRDFIDNRHTFYLGSISEEMKVFFCKRARLASFITPMGTMFNQSVIECLAHGTPILIKDIKPTRDPTFLNWLKDIIIDNFNGVVYDGNNFLRCWEESKKIQQINCWKTAQNFSIEKMLESFEKAILDILADSEILTK